MDIYQRAWRSWRELSWRKIRLLSWQIFPEKTGNIVVKIRFSGGHETTDGHGNGYNTQPAHFRRKSPSQVECDRARVNAHTNGQTRGHTNQRQGVITRSMTALASTPETPEVPRVYTPSPLALDPMAPVFATSPPVIDDSPASRCVSPDGTQYPSPLLPAESSIWFWCIVWFPSRNRYWDRSRRFGWGLHRLLWLCLF